MMASSTVSDWVNKKLPRQTCRCAFVCVAVAVPLSVLAQGPQIPQGENSQNWLTAGADAQRDSWIRKDPHISLESMRNPVGFGVVRKVKPGEPGAGFASQVATEAA